MGPFAIGWRIAGLSLAPELRLRGTMLQGMVIEASGIGAGVLGPLSLKLAIDRLSHKPPDGAAAAVFVVIFAGSWAFTAFTATACSAFTGRVIGVLSHHLSAGALSSRLVAAVRERTGDSGATLGQIERLPFSLFVVVDALIWRVLPLLLQTGLSLVVALRYLPVADVFILAVVLIAFAAGTTWSARRERSLADGLNQSSTVLSALLGDILRNARRVVLNGALGFELEGVAEAYGRKLRADRRMTLSMVLSAAIRYGVVGGGLCVLLLMAVRDVVSGRTSVASFVLLQAYAFRLITPFSSFGYIFGQARLAFSNIGDVLEMARQTPVRAGELPASEPSPDIRIFCATFRYAGSEGGIENITAEFPAGSFNVIAGPNGSGKSTLAQVLAGILDPLTGGVEVGNVAMRDIPIADRHRHILYVPQQAGLFNRSLGENALYPPTGYSLRQVGNLLDKWRFYGDGRPIDFGLMTGEQGERLSGGQIQKLELARLAGTSAPVIVLDESTSALDPSSEAVIFSDLRGLWEGEVTLIAISHRREIAELADQVLFMKAGRLAATGSHLELMQREGEYRAFWEASDR